ncbi:MAG TPA: cation:proton antiporter [Methanobacteriaceae archaeon]|nr:cation:proton antiporter [Methanobacteriaceae archaeon]
MMEVIFFFAILFAFALFSRRLSESPITAQMVFCLTGIFLGYIFAQQVNQEFNRELLLLVAEVALVLVLFSDASGINFNTFQKNKLTWRMLSIGLILTIIIGIIVGAYLLTDMVLWEVAALAAVLAPTDAALGQIVVQNKKLPHQIRETLEIESGLNDGIAVPFLLLFLGFGLAEETFRPINYFLVTTFEQIVFGVLIGLGVGLIGGWMVLQAKKKSWITKTYQRLALLALAILSWLITDQLGGSGFIAAFVGGLSTGFIFEDAGDILTDFTRAEGMLLSLSVFFIMGALITPLLSFVTWKIIFYAVLSLTLIRMLPVAISLIGTKISLDTVLFLGWFGPRGLASIVLALVALEAIPEFPGKDTFTLTILVTVFLSIILHGITALPLSELYIKRDKKVKGDS